MCSDILMILALWCLLRTYSYKKGMRDGYEKCVRERILKLRPNESFFRCPPL